MKPRRPSSRAIFYTRDSAGKSELAPGAYVEQAITKCHELNLVFAGSKAQIEDMIKKRTSVQGDLYLDYGVKGHKLSRIGLDAMRERVATDTSISHVIIPRRSRLARPDDPLDGMKLENFFREHRVALVLLASNQVISGDQPSTKDRAVELIHSAIEYGQAGTERQELGSKILLAQKDLAEEGFATGGRPLYGFRRFLLRPDGDIERLLEDGEVSKRRGYRVRWLPHPKEEVEVLVRILRELFTKNYAQVAADLTRDGILTPADRFRVKDGVLRGLRNPWLPRTVENLARHALLHAETQYGRKSQGDTCRFSPTGPRPLTDDERDEDRARVVMNPPDQYIRCQVDFTPLISREEHQRLVAILDQRAGRKFQGQRGRPGRPRSCWVFDLECERAMYRYSKPKGARFRLRCSEYERTRSKACKHNTIDGLTAYRFAMSVLSEQLSSPAFIEKLQRRTSELLKLRKSAKELAVVHKRAVEKVSELEEELALVTENLALATSEAKHKAISKVFDQRLKELNDAKTDLELAKKKRHSSKAADVKVEQISSYVDQLPNLTKNALTVAAAQELFRATKTQLFLGFHEYRKTKKDGSPGLRALRRLRHGVICIGNGPRPIEVDNGPTRRDPSPGAESSESDDVSSIPSDEPSSSGKCKPGVPGKPATRKPGTRPACTTRTQGVPTVGHAQ